MRKIITLLAIFIFPTISFSQRFFVKDNNMPIDVKLKKAISHAYELADSSSANVIIEVFFSGKFNFWKGGKYQGSYKLFDNSGNEIHSSGVWTVKKYGGLAEDDIVKYICKQLKNKYPKPKQ